MRTNDLGVGPRFGAREATCLDDTHGATQFGDSLRSAARRTGTPNGHSKEGCSRPGADGAGPAQDESLPAHSTPGARTAASVPSGQDSTHGAPQPAASPRTAAAPAQARMPAPPAPAPRQAPPPSPRRTTTPRDGNAPPAAGEAHSDTTRTDAAQACALLPADPRDERPHARVPGHDHAPRRATRRHADPTAAPDGVALQTLLAAAHPLLPGPNDTAVAAPTSPVLTPHDVAASVSQAWLREPSTQDVAGGERGAQWTFTLGDPLTPLAALRISGDAAAGWGLQLTAGNGLPARDLAAYTERLRRRLRARGQAVDRLEVDDDPQR